MMNLHMLSSENKEQYIWRLGQAKDLGEIDMTWEELANIINNEIEDKPTSESAYRKSYACAKRFYEAGVFDKKEKTVKELQMSFNEEVTINKDNSYSSSKLIQMNEEESRNPDFVLKAHGFDIGCWKIVSARNTIRQVISKQDGIVTLYASYITVKPIVDLTLNQIENFYKELISKYPSPVIKKSKKISDGYLLEIPVQDVHFGKLGFSENDSETYNYVLAKERFSYVIDDVIENVSGMNIEKIIFPVGSDFFHIDTYESTTTAGTKQNSDLSPQLIFKYGLECLIENILKLSTIAPVELFCVNGNHDFLTSYHAICSLNCYFINNENVTVDTSISPRKYVEFGKCLIGFSHGDKEKKRIEGLMQIEAREAWGRTKYHEFHLGHLHSEQTKEVNGIIIRNLSSFTGTDMWHHNSGYVGAVKKCECFIWDKECGLKNILITTFG